MRRNCKRGFSLLELLIVLGMGATLLYGGMRVTDITNDSLKRSKERFNARNSLAILGRMSYFVGKSLIWQNFNPLATHHIIDPDYDPQEKSKISPVHKVGKNFYGPLYDGPEEEWPEDPQIIMYASGRAGFALPDSMDPSAVTLDSFTLERSYMKNEGGALKKVTFGAIASRCVPSVGFDISNDTPDTAAAKVFTLERAPFMYYDDRGVIVVRCCPIVSDQPTCLDGDTGSVESDWRVRLFLVSADPDTLAPTKVLMFPARNVGDSITGIGFSAFFDRPIDPTSMDFYSFAMSNPCINRYERGADLGDCQDVTKTLTWNRRFIASGEITGASMIHMGRVDETSPNE